MKIPKLDKFDIAVIIMIAIVVILGMTFPPEAKAATECYKESTISDGMKENYKAHFLFDTKRKGIEYLVYKNGPKFFVVKKVLTNYCIIHRLKKY